MKIYSIICFAMLHAFNGHAAGDVCSHSRRSTSFDFEPLNIKAVSFQLCLKGVKNPFGTNTIPLSQSLMLLKEQGIKYYENMNQELMDSFNSMKISENAIQNDRNTVAIRRIENKMLRTTHGSAFEMAKYFALSAIYLHPFGHAASSVMTSALYAATALHSAPERAPSAESDRRLGGWDVTIDKIKEESKNQMRELSLNIWPNKIYPELACRFLPATLKELTIKRSYTSNERLEVKKLRQLFKQYECDKRARETDSQVSCHESSNMAKSFYQANTGKNDAFKQFKKTVAHRLLQELPRRDLSPLSVPHIAIYPQERLEVCDDKGASYFRKYRERVALQSFNSQQWNIEVNAMGGGELGCMLSGTDQSGGDDKVSLASVGLPILLQFNLSCNGAPIRPTMGIEFDSKGRMQNFRTNIADKNISWTSKPGVATMMLTGSNFESHDNTGLLHGQLPQQVRYWEGTVPGLRIKKSKICQTSVRQVQTR